MKRAVVAIVGKPNVGKSSLFNRIVGERKSIVYDQPGVTRDRIYAKTSWLTREFNIIDTGGIEIENRPFQESIRAQAEIAIDEADSIIFIVNGKEVVLNAKTIVLSDCFQVDETGQITLAEDIVLVCGEA